MTDRDYNAHEALDRLHIIASMIDDHLLSHPYIQNRPELLKLINAASQRISDAYQRVGEEHLP